MTPPNNIAEARTLGADGEPRGGLEAEQRGMAGLQRCQGFQPTYSQNDAGGLRGRNEHEENFP